MYNYKIKFTKKPKGKEITDNEIFDMIDDYFNTLNNNGQVISGFEMFAVDDNNIFLSTVFPRENSLSDNNNNDYVKERLQKLQDFFDIEFILEGGNFEYNISCVCKKPSWYFLYNIDNDGESPLICGDCRKPIPLYEVPYILKEKEHRPILNWQAAHNAIITLWFHGLWDRFTYGETARFNSKLNREGRKICKAFEKVLGVPVYYFIYYFCEKDDEEYPMIPKGLPNKIPTVCPQCNGEWIDDNEFCKCAKCRLITDSPQWKKKRNLL
ncbi:MAG: Zn-ribbon-containing protein [Firmicutes bacterium]|nr:Zn-ribbon-containing protein [Bacillota bacterium]